MAIIHDGGIDREMTADEISIAEAMKAEAIAQAEADSIAAAERAAKRQAVLDKLGLTQNEAAALLG
jgi:hypothetical protein